MVGHLLQYHPAFIKLKELAASGELGRINYIYSHRLNLGKIRREENILWSFAPHDISMILSLAGSEPEMVQTTGGYYLHQRIADVTTTHLDFPSGLKAHIFVSWLHPFKEQKLVVVGDKKMVVFDDTLDWPEKLQIFPHRIEWHNNMPVPVKANPERVEYPRDEPLKQECLHFLDCIANRKKPITDGNEGLRVLRVLNASQLSMDQQGKRIRLDGRKDRAPTSAGPGSRPPAAVAAGAFVHETAIVDAGAVVGTGTKIWHFSHVLSGSKIGERCNIGQNVVIGPDVTIGSSCKIQNNVSVYKGVTLEDGVFCGPSMVFTNIYNPRAEIPKMDQVRPTLVEKGSHHRRQRDHRLWDHSGAELFCRGRGGRHAQRARPRAGRGKPGQADRVDLRVRRTLERRSRMRGMRQCLFKSERRATAEKKLARHNYRLVPDDQQNCHNYRGETSIH